MSFLYFSIFVYFGVTGRLWRDYIRAQIILRVCQEIFDLSRKIKFKMHYIQKPLEGRNVKLQNVSYSKGEILVKVE
ncbi:hypothetical protein CN285_14240 [Bacillus cereus]|nr:hypothetical protein CN285_14240 [Bacillus cereus]PGM64800.1 hypothetical protein CN947_06605 [Bacillus cereus]